MQVFTLEQEKFIVAGIKNRNEKIFEEFYSTSLPLVKNFLLKNYSNCPAFEVDDILQELYFKIWTKIDSFSGKGKLISWTYQIASYIVFDRVFRNKYVKNCVSLDSITDSGGEFAAKIIETENNERLTNKIGELKNCLGEKHLAIFNLVYEQGMSFKQVAKKTRLPMGTVLSRSHYLKQKIKRELGV